MISIRFFWYFLIISTMALANNDIAVLKTDKYKSIVSSFVSNISNVVNKGATTALDIVNYDKNDSENFEQVWEETFYLFKDGGVLEAEYDTVPESAIIARDKDDVKEDINDILDDVINVLTDGQYILFRKSLNKLKENIKDLKSNIIEYREKKILAPVNSLVYTTQKEYDKKIKIANEHIQTYKNEQEVLKKRLKQYFINSGVKLDPQQVDMLLYSVDGDDMIKMTLVLKVLNRITDQLMSILEDSNEELRFAKKYYAMHLLSFDLVVHIYQKYIDKVDKIYFVKLKKIMDETTQILYKTNTLVENETNKDRKKIYLKNIEAQELTQRAVILYMNYLEKNKNKIVEIQKIAKKNLNLARNTYKTVVLGTQLQSLMTDNKYIFHKLLTIQMPDIMPFENTQLKLKFQELTNQLEDN